MILVNIIILFNYFVGIYYGIVNIFYTLLVLIALYVSFIYVLKIRNTKISMFYNFSKFPPVSIIVPVYNEEKTIIDIINSLLKLRYPEYEIIIVNDGSTDRSLSLIVETFRLRKIDLFYRKFLQTKDVRGFYFSNDYPNLLVIDKYNGGKADALNCGINVSRYPYFCSIDADTLLEKDALIRLMYEIIINKEDVVAVGGVVRILNGSKKTDKYDIEIDLPKNPLVNFQIVEYLQGFLFGRVGLNFLSINMILSGALSLFKKDAVVKVGGYSVNNIAEDMEIVVRLHRYYLENKLPYKITFVDDPVCWTIVPEDLKGFYQQRRRWHIGLIQTLIAHIKMFLNPKYKSIGLIGMPYYLFVEFLGPSIEFLGYISVVVSYFLGILSVNFLILFFFLAIVYGMFLSLSGVLLEELTYKRYPKWKHLFKLIIYAFLYNLGYRQLTTAIRFISTLVFFFTKKRKW